jgi:hypothetical protein
MAEPSSARVEARAGDGQGHHRQPGGDRPGARAAPAGGRHDRLGKSVAVNAMILSMLYKATPEDVRLIMIDPKMLELSVYEGIPHLLAPVVTDMKQAAHALNWCVGEMESATG